MALKVGITRRPLAINVEVTDVFQQLRLQGPRIHGGPAPSDNFRRAENSVFAIFAARQHAAAHVAIDGHHGKCRERVGHPHGDAIAG